MEKIISIIVPCFNVEKYIDRCFQSLENQTIGIEKLEIIFVDDGSTDHTWEHLVAMEQKYPDSIAIIHCDENGHQGKARNIGMEYASAPYLGFVDSDDWVEPDMFERMYEKICSYNSDIVMCNSWRDTGKPEQVLSSRRVDGREDRQLLINTMEKRKCLLANSSIGFCVWNKLFKRELIMNNNILFPEQLAYEDHYFATLLYFYVEKVYILEERLYHYFINEQSTVMEDNAVHHFDILSVDTLLWEECEKRGFLRDYRKEMEYQFLSLCYLTSVKMLLLRFENVPYDFFRKMQQEVLLRVPNYHDNQYVAEFVTDLYKIILELLDRDLTEPELNAIFCSLRNYVKKGQLKV